MSDLTFSYAHVERTLAKMHLINERMSAFSSRLKHYQKRGFPSGINTGRGKAATYRIEHIVKLALATECNQMGLTPERAALVCTNNIDQIRAAIRLAALSFRASDILPMFIYFDPSALDDLRDDYADDDADLSFSFAGIGVLHDLIDQWSVQNFRRMALLNISAMVVKITAYLAEFSSYSRQQILDDLIFWSEAEPSDQHPQA
ncbi:hypothetical protein [Sphingobium ummariense]